MRSTFMGLEASKKGLFVQQSALYTTGHNISNANTEGYTRQRVNMQASPGFPYPGLNSPQYPGHMGTGVEAHSIQRMRDEFTDRQFRQEANKLGYWDSTLNSINQMEDILTEPSEYGINQAFTDFWRGFQDVADNPDDSAARKVAIAKAEALADAFNYNYTQLETIQGNLGNEIFVANREINTILEKIAAINAQVQALEPNGYVTNDLYDARDLLVDELNQYIPVSIERIPSGGRASEVAEGALKITFTANVGGTPTPVVLVDGKNAGKVEILDAAGNPIDSAIDAGDAYSLFGTFNMTAAEEPGSGVPGATTGFKYEDLESSHMSRGKMMALIDAYGHADPDKNGLNGIYPEMMKELDKVAQNFVEVFNQAHAAGYTLNPTTPANATGIAFFDATGVTAKNMKVAQSVIDDPNLIAASSRPNEEGNGRWAIELSNLQYKNITATMTVGTGILNAPITITPSTGLGGFTFQDYYTGLIGDLAVEGSKSKTNQFNAQTQMLTVTNNRASMNSVSLDEEMTNMITFQQAYNANARMITVVDETLDKIINGMGRVGL